MLGPVPAAEPTDVVGSLFLIGDAGGPVDHDQVLAAVENDLKKAPHRSYVVFLGDNVYPHGLPDSSATEFRQAAERLTRQIEVVTRSNVRGLFIPGNHDWDKSGPLGLDRVRFAERTIARVRGDSVVQLPSNGCPGPAPWEAGPFLVIALDTEWWLGKHARGAPCGAATDSAVAAQLSALIAGAGSRHVVVAGHHPLRTGGAHGGKFSLLEHLFPLRHVKPWLWVPLPLIGSLYPIARANGISRQDVSNSRNREMRLAIENAMRPHRPLAYAAGHEHTLQVFAGDAARWFLVSGSGYYAHGGYVASVDSTRYRSSASGYMRLDALRDGRVRLAVIVVDATGVREDGSTWME